MKRLAFSLFVLAIFVVVSSSGYAVPFIIHQLTDNPIIDGAPSLYNGTIAWRGNDGNDLEIYYWDGSNITPITTNSINDNTPSLYNGAIAWTSPGSINYWDGKTVEVISAGTNPSLYNGTIAWQWHDGSDWDIYYWNGSTITNVSNNDLADGRPSLYNGTIAWDVFDGNDREIYYWNGSTIIQLTNNDVDDLGPSLYNGTIAWQASDGNDREIYYWNGSNIIQVTNNDTNDGPVSLYNGTIAWRGNDGNDTEIYYWDGNTITQVTNNDTTDNAPSLYNGIIAWGGSDGEIYYAVPIPEPSTIVLVPGDQPTIQAGIDAAQHGDTVLVADGTYTGDGNKNLDFKGKAITVQSENGAESTTIDCESEGRGFYFHSGETLESVVSGFTITNGYVTSPGGGGIYCEDSSPTIQNNTISGNSTNGSGGGIYCHTSDSIITNNNLTRNWAGISGGGIKYIWNSPTITYNTITLNSARGWGGGIYCDHSSATIANNTIIENSTTGAPGEGGGIFCDYSFPIITNNTITRNSANDGGGIYCYLSSSPMITNTILWNNSPEEIYLDVDSSITITYSDIQDGWEGETNIDVDPMFVDPGNGDYHLQASSLCIDAGDPVSQLDPDGTRADIGALYYDQSVIPVATTLEKVSGDNQSGDVGSVLPDPLVVRVLDQNSEPMEGVTVNFEASEGASANPTQAMTNGNGQAQTVLTLGAQPGEYSVTVSVEGLGPVVFTATAIGVPVLVVDAGEDKTICHPNNGGETQIGGNPTASDGTPPYSYSWTPTTGLDNPDIANPTAGPTTKTTYTVTVTDSSEPPQEVSDSVTVTVYPELIADAGENKNIAPGGSIQMGGNPTASGGTVPYTYTWTPIESLDSPDIANPTASPTETTTYTVTVTDDNGCEDTDEITVTVVEGLYAQIIYPVEGAYIRGEIIITGTVLGGQNGLKSWILKRTKIGGQYKTISYGDTEVDNGELGSWDTTAGDEGQHMLRLTAVDNADNERVHEITVNVDNTDPAPVIELQSDGASGDWTKDYTDLYVSGEVEAGAQLIETYLIFEGGLPFTDDVKDHIGIDGTGRIAGTIPDGYNLSGNDITTVTLHMRCKDRAGNEGEGTSNTLHVDNDKPTVTIQNPVSDANFNLFNKDILIAGIADDAFGISRVEINIYDGSGWIPVTGATNWEHKYFQNNEVAVVTVHARSIDNAGNASEIAERKFHCIWDFPSMNISFPVDGSVVSGVVGITGLVVDSDINDSDLHWSVDYGIGEHKINNIASGYGNKSVLLCNWDTRRLDTGQLYTLFLTVTSSSTMASRYRFDDYYVNSAGELVVKRYNISVVEPSIIYGDVNDDGKVTPLDAALVMQHVVGELTLNSNQQLRADVTGNGALSSMDAALILQKITGLIVEFPVR